MGRKEMLDYLLYLTLTNFGVVLLVIAILFIFLDCIVSRRRISKAEIIFRWTAFFLLGVLGIYTGFLHIYSPNVTAATVGWPTSPFQFEVAMADFSIGLLGIFAFKASNGFRAATVLAALVYLWGNAFGHFSQILRYQNFTAGNAGPALWLDLLVPLILLICLPKLKHTGRRLFS